MSGNQRVLMVAAQYPPVYGGAGTQASMLARQLKDLGWETRVLTLDQHHIGSGWDRDTWVHRVWRLAPSNVFLRLGATLALSLGSFWTAIRFRPDVIHVHGTYWWSIAPILVGRLLNSVTVLKTTRDGEDDPVTVFSKKILGIPVGRLYGLSLSLADAVIVLNSAAEEGARELGLGRSVSLIRNGVDSELFQRTSARRSSARRKFEIEPGIKVISFVGYAVAHKGFFDLIEAIQKVNKTRFEFWVVGPTSGFYRELTENAALALEKLRKAGIIVREFGLVARHEMPEIYWATDIFALPSYAEGMPNSLAEALVAGCEIVTTGIPGISDFFSASDDIELMVPGDVDGLSNYLSRLIDDAGQDTASAFNQLSGESVGVQYASLYTRTRAKK